MLVSLSSFGQYKNFIIGPKGDTLNRIDTKGKKQGPWVIHVDDNHGERGYEEEGYFLNDKKDGTWRQYSLDGDLMAVENYRWGNKDGKCQYFTNIDNICLKLAIFDVYCQYSASSAITAVLSPL